MTAPLRQLRPNWVRHDGEGWEVGFVDRTTLRYAEDGRTTDIPVDMGLRGQQAVVHLNQAEVDGVVALPRLRAALDFLDIALVVDGEDPGTGSRPGGPWPRS